MVSGDSAALSAVHDIRARVAAAENAFDSDGVITLLDDDVVLMVPDYRR